MATTPITKADFETAWGRPLTDAQYEQLRMGLQMGMLDKGVNSGGKYDHTLPRSTASMPEEQRNAIARLNWLAAGRPGEPGGNLFDAAPTQGQQAPAASPATPGRAKAGTKATVLRADGTSAGPLDDRAVPVQAPTKVYAGNGQGVKGWQKKAIRPGYGWVDVDNGSEPASVFAPEPDNGWENGQAPAPAKIVLGQGQTPAASPVEIAPQNIAPVPQPAPGDPAPKAVPATGSGDISAAKKKAAADVAELEKEAATLDDPFAAAAAKGKADILALEKDAAALPAPISPAAPAPPKPYVGTWVTPPKKAKKGG